MVVKVRVFTSLFFNFSRWVQRNRNYKSLCHAFLHFSFDRQVIPSFDRACTSKSSCVVSQWPKDFPKDGMSHIDRL